eukprot:bmy_03993T0
MSVNMMVKGMYFCIFEFLQKKVQPVTRYELQGYPVLQNTDSSSLYS